MLTQCEICPEFTYSLILEANFTCQRCNSKKILCKGGDGWGNNILQIQPGFWRGKLSSRNEIDIFECEDYAIYGENSVCKGGSGFDESLCKPGSIGALCNDCDIFSVYSEKSYY